MLLSQNICVVVRPRLIENRVMKETEFIAVVWRHILFVAEIVTARNRMRKSAGSKKRSPVYQSF